MDISAKTEADRLFLYHLSSLFFHEEKEAYSVSRRDGQEFVEIEIARKEEKSISRCALSLSLHKELSRAKNAAAGLAFARAARAFSPYTPPYGTLLGVRPVKVPLYYLEMGKARDEITKLLREEFLVSEEKAALLLSLAEKERQAKASLAPTDAMLYLSIPFCPSRCSYCSFISSAAPSQLRLLDDYVALLTQEICQTAKAMREDKKTLRCIYVGGGTPGILSPRQMDALLSAVREEFDLGRLSEFCVEIGRPDTVTEEKLSLLRERGVDRISINPQTVHDKTLERIGRRHTAEDFFRAMELAQRYDFPVINCDLIAALPGEGEAELCESVERVLALRPQNLTLHALSLKKSADDQQAPRSPIGMAKAVEKAHGACINAGLFPYYLYRQKNTASDLENLGFAQEGKESLYNLAMMEDLTDVYACGAGGIGKAVPNDGNGRIRRYPQYKYPYEYLADPKRAEELLARRRRDAAEKESDE